MATLMSGSDDLFTAYVCGRERAENRSFLSRQLERASTVIGERGRRFLERARAAFDAYDHEAVDRGLRALKATVESRWSDNEIVLCRTIGELQRTNPRNARFLAANPTIRKAVKAGRCHGWSDIYVDLEPGLWGEKHSDWRRVMNGMAVVDADNGEVVFNRYLDVLDEDGREEITFGEQCVTLRNWDLTDDHMHANLDDPSDPSNGAL